MPTAFTAPTPHPALHPCTPGFTARALLTPLLSSAKCTRKAAAHCSAPAEVVPWTTCCYRGVCSPVTQGRVCSTSCPSLAPPYATPSSSCSSCCSVPGLPGHTSCLTLPLGLYRWWLQFRERSSLRITHNLNSVRGARGTRVTPQWVLQAGTQGSVIWQCKLSPPSGGSGALILPGLLLSSKPL